MSAVQTYRWTVADLPATTTVATDPAHLDGDRVGRPWSTRPRSGHRSALLLWLLVEEAQVSRAHTAPPRGQLWTGSRTLLIAAALTSSDRLVVDHRRLHGVSTPSIPALTGKVPPRRAEGPVLVTPTPHHWRVLKETKETHSWLLTAA